MVRLIKHFGPNLADSASGVSSHGFWDSGVSKNLSRIAHEPPISAFFRDVSRGWFFGASRALPRPPTASNGISIQSFGSWTAVKQSAITLSRLGDPCALQVATLTQMTRPC